MHKDEIKRDKIAGAIYGFAIGDAMGATTEFMPKDEIKYAFKSGKVTDIIGGGWLNLDAGDVTDDTQMTICVMNAFMKAYDGYSSSGFNFVVALREEFIKWYKSRPKDIGGQCHVAINYMMKNHIAAYVDENALGNGSLMRALPMALVNEPLLNELQSKMTHNNSKCTLVVLEYHHLIQSLLNNNLYMSEPKSLLEPSGYIVNTFNNSVYWASKGSFDEAIIGAVNDGGDADTIAAIAGSLAGAKFGFSSIPERWINQLNPDIKIILEKFKNFVFNYVQI